MNAKADAPKPKSRLGRGLSSLLSMSDPPVEIAVTPQKSDDSMAKSEAQGVRERRGQRPDTHETSGGVAEIAVDQIQPNPHQPRRQFDDAALGELAASLRSTGLIQPIVVKRDGIGYQLIAGERRLRAAKLAGLASIPAVIREADAYTQAQMALVENIQRQDLNALDRAEAYQTLLTQLGLTQAELATRLGEDRSSIANYLRLLDLIEPVREMVRLDQLSLGHAKLLAGVTDAAEQSRLANLVISQDLSVRNLERLIAVPSEIPNARPAKTVSAHVQDLERSLTRQLGLRVQLHSGKGGKGKLIIHYASLDQFDTLTERLGLDLE